MAMIERQSTNQTPIGVFTALSWESAAVRAGFSQFKREGEKIWRGTVGGRELVVVTGGIGLRRTQRMLEQFGDAPFAAILSIGCAGALIPGLTTGQLVLAPDVCMQAATAEPQFDRFPVDPRLLAHTRTAAIQGGVPTAEGSLFTSPKVLFTPEEKGQRGKETGAIAVEMESGVHAAFAAARGLPFLVLRVILDGVDMRIPAVAGLTTPEGDIRPFKAARYVVTHPHYLSVLLTLNRARATAAQTLSRLCHALFPLLTADSALRTSDF